MKAFCVALFWQKKPQTSKEDHEQEDMPLTFCIDISARRLLASVHALCAHIHICARLRHTNYGQIPKSALPHS